MTWRFGISTKKAFAGDSPYSSMASRAVQHGSQQVRGAVGRVTPSAIWKFELEMKSGWTLEVHRPGWIMCSSTPGSWQFDDNGKLLCRRDADSTLICKPRRNPLQLSLRFS